MSQKATKRQLPFEKAPMVTAAGAGFGAAAASAGNLGGIALEDATNSPTPYKVTTNHKAQTLDGPFSAGKTASTVPPRESDRLTVARLRIGEKRADDPAARRGAACGGCGAAGACGSRVLRDTAPECCVQPCLKQLTARCRRSQAHLGGCGDTRRDAAWAPGGGAAKETGRCGEKP